MKYAVIAISGTQYMVTENQVITVDKLDMEAGKSGSVNQVLLTVNDKDVKIGTPAVKGAVVDYEVVSQHQGDKVEVSTFKAKSRYRRHIGFRAQLTDIKITKITF